MAASESETLSRIHVSSLGSFVFCPRAGVIAFKSQSDSELQEEPRVPNLSYLPMFNEDALREKFQAIFPGFLRVWGVMLASTFVLWVIARFGSPSLAAFLCIALVPIGYVAFRDTPILISILAELSRYKHRPATPLDSSINQEIPITWWGLIKLGYKPVKPVESFVDDDLQLSGRPWRLLSNNDGERIPVIGLVENNLNVCDSHRAKLAAYCYLLESQQRATSNWGILLDRETRNGIAIPIGELLQHQALNQLKAFRKMLGERSLQLPIPIPVASACKNCPFGKPRIYKTGESETTYSSGPIGAKTEMGRNGQLVHCHCGDEFHWIPPHNYWDAKSDLAD